MAITTRQAQRSTTYRHNECTSGSLVENACEIGENSHRVARASMPFDTTWEIHGRTRICVRLLNGCVSPMTLDKNAKNGRHTTTRADAAHTAASGTRWNCAVPPPLAPKMYCTDSGVPGPIRNSTMLGWGAVSAKPVKSFSENWATTGSSAHCDEGRTRRLCAWPGAWMTNSS